MISFTQTPSSEIILQGAASQVHCLVDLHVDNWRPATNNYNSHVFYCSQILDVQAASGHCLGHDEDNTYVKNKR